jgi:hypothetical protein
VLIATEGSIDLPSAARVAERVPLVRKQDFGPRLFKRIWREHGS